MEYLIESIKRLLEIVSLAKVNIQKSIVFLYTVNKSSEVKTLNIPFTIASKNMKYG